MQFFKTNVVDWIVSGIRTLMAMICQFLYPLISNLYNLFVNISKVDILSSEQLKPIYQRVTLMLTIVMVFYVTFECVKYIVQPEGLTDKDKGLGNIVYKMVLVVVLIAFVPRIFEGANVLQNAIIEKNVIGQVILGTKTNVDVEKLGSTFSSSLLSIGYTIDEDKVDENCGDLKCGTIVNMNISTLATMNKLPYLTMGLDATVEETAPTANQEKVKVSAINFEFNGFLSVVLGLLIAYILVLYCVDVGVRWAQLVYLQIIAPIPIIGYLSPKKDGIFQKWVKQCITTYLDLFLRTAIIYLVLLLSSTLLEAYHNPNNNDLLANVAPNLRMWVFIFLVLGVMMFAKKAPKMLSELFPKGGAASGNLGLSLKDRPAVARAAGMAIGAGIVSAKGAIAGSINQTKRNWRNLKTGKHKNDLADYGRSSVNRVKSFGTRFGAGVKYWQTIGDKNAHNAAKEDLQKAKQQYRDAKIEQQSAKAAVQNSRPRFGSLAGVTGAIGGAVRGATAGVQATDMKGIQKQVSQGLKNETKALEKTEKWYKEGGGSQFDRAISGIEKSLGITTESETIANEIKHEEDIIKENEALIASEGNVKNKADEVEKRIDSKLNTDSKAQVDANAQAYLTSKFADIDLSQEIDPANGNPIPLTMADLRKRYKAKTESAQAALDEAVKRNNGNTNAPDVVNAQVALKNAITQEDLVKKHTMRAAFTQVLQGNNDDPVAVQRKDMLLQSISDARRNSDTVRKLRDQIDGTSFTQTDFDAFMSGKIENYDQFDAINGKLQGIINNRNMENARRKETKRKLEASAKNAAAKANNN